MAPTKSTTIKNLLIEKAKYVQRGDFKRAIDICDELSCKYKSNEEVDNALLEFQDRLDFAERLEDRHQIALAHR